MKQQFDLFKKLGIKVKIFGVKYQNCPQLLFLLQYLLSLLILLYVHKVEQLTKLRG